MKKVHIYVYLFDGFADWELSYILPELNTREECVLHYFSDSKTEVKSKGGLIIIPELAIQDVDISTIDMLILPGGNLWEQQGFVNEELDRVLYGAYMNKRGIGAICGATIYLANQGLLDVVAHTSNALLYLAKCSTVYTGHTKYQEESAVRDGNIITAGGIAPIEFAREIMLYLEWDALYVEKWYQLFKNGIWQQ